MITTKRSRPSAEQLFQTMLRERQTGFQKELVRVSEEWNAESVHDLRVACRRFRSALRGFGPFLDPAGTQPMGTALQAFMQEFNSLRDLDVQLELLEKMPLPPQPALKNRIAEVVAVFRSKKKITDRKLKEYLQVNSNIGAISLPQPLAEALPSSQEGIRIVLKSELAHAVEHLKQIPWEMPRETIKPFHELRIQFKHLRYGVELFAEFLGKEASELLKVFKRIQDLLGWIHDLDTLSAAIRKLWRRQARDRQILVRTLVRELPWPLPVEFDPTRRLRPAPKDHQKAFLYILVDLTRQRAEHFKASRNLLQIVESLDWANSLDSWFTRGVCPTTWKKEFASHEN